jgi:tRNA (mo5U34)-methyltransferase
VAERVANAELVQEIREREWFHTIDLGDGLVTRGNPPSELLSLPNAIPEVRGQSVLDIGAWDGKYSFEAERAGASRVVALDHFVWRLNPAKLRDYYEACEREGRLPDPDLVSVDFLEVDTVPLKRGFDLAHTYLDSRVEAIVDDFMTMDLNKIGTFDIVFYFGVLYHMSNPLGALQRLRRVTGNVAVIETAAIWIPGYPDTSLVEFYPGKERNGDYTNWFAPTEAALHGMCRAAGFSRVETKAARTTPRRPSTAAWRRIVARQEPLSPSNHRLVVHAFP